MGVLWLFYDLKSRESTSFALFVIRFFFFLSKNLFRCCLYLVHMRISTGISGIPSHVIISFQSDIYVKRTTYFVPP